MRVAIAGVGHWHTPYYLEPLLGQKDVRVVGVSDSASTVASSYAERLGCAHDTDFAALCARVRPDFAFVLGVHGDMAREAETLIEAGIPFAVEKPAGVSAEQVRVLAARARQAGLFVSVPLVFRSSDFFRTVLDHAATEDVLYADFKFIAGLPDRYRAAGCDWIFDRRRSGGGTLLNLGVHFLDLFQLLTCRHGARVSAADAANLGGQGDVEDYVALVLRHGASVGRVETGYLYPAPAGVFDMHFSVRTARHYVAATEPGWFEVSEMDGTRTRIEGTTTNMPLYPRYVADVLQQVRTGAKPVADLQDMADVLALAEEAYGLAAAARHTSERIRSSS